MNPLQQEPDKITNLFENIRMLQKNVSHENMTMLQKNVSHATFWTPDEDCPKSFGIKTFLRIHRCLKYSEKKFAKPL